jgi:hypothetical protein
MDILQLYQDYSVDHLTEGHKHCREGWVNTPCPFCTGNPGYHLGFNIEDNYYFCWRCGWHPISMTVGKLLNITEQEARKIIRQYGLILHLPKKNPVTITKVVDHRLPSGTGPLGKNHRAYLESRNFDPDKLERIWKLVGTGPISLLDGIDYKHRIVIPFIWDNKQVSFDSRDITGKHMARYMACPKERELIPHKEILYGKQEHWNGTGICVEGPTDTWRLGPFSFAVSGIKYTQVQLRIIAKSFKRVVVLFDNDPQAKIQGEKMVADLAFRGVDAFKVDIEGDPGSMKQSDADYLVKQLIK